MSSIAIYDSDGLHNISNGESYYLVQNITVDEPSDLNLQNVDIDGNGCKIRVEDPAPLFHIISASSTIKNLTIVSEHIDVGNVLCKFNYGTLDEVTVVIKNTRSMLLNGGLAVENHGVIKNTDVSINNVECDGKRLYMSGLVDKNTGIINDVSIDGQNIEGIFREFNGICSMSSGPIKQCSVDIDLTVDSSRQAVVSGILNEGCDMKLQDCTVTINGKVENTSICGVASHLEDSIIRNCTLSDSELTESSQFAGLAEKIYNTRIGGYTLEKVQVTGDKIFEISGDVQNSELNKVWIKNFRSIDTDHHSTFGRIDTQTGTDIKYDFRHLTEK